MKPVSGIASPGGRFFNTLAQSGTRCGGKKQIIVTGNGTDLSNTKALLGRAKRKTITQKMALSLVDVATCKNEKERIKSYWNTYHCQNRVISSGNRIYGKYCKNRFCTLCCSNRKAEIMNKYLPIIKTWKEPYFVTLTVKSVPAKRLDYIITNGMVRAFKIILNRFKKRNQRGKGFKFMGIKSLECNFNPARRTYNPHFHVIVPDKETADLLVNEWLKLWTTEFTGRAAQNATPVKDKEKALIEIVKYGSKIFSEPDLKIKNKVPPKVYTAALHNILNAMKDHRIFERFGFNLPPPEKNQKSKAKSLIEYNNFEFDIMQRDWVNPENDQKLTGYLPSAELLGILENNVDIVNE